MSRGRWRGYGGHGADDVGVHDVVHDRVKQKTAAYQHRRGACGHQWRDPPASGLRGADTCRGGGCGPRQRWERLPRKDLDVVSCGEGTFAAPEEEN